VTGNPTIDRWTAQGRLVPAAVPGTVLVEVATIVKGLGAKVDLVAEALVPAGPTRCRPSSDRWRCLWRLTSHVTMLA